MRPPRPTADAAPRGRARALQAHALARRTVAMLVASTTLVLGSCTDATPTRDPGAHPAPATTVPSASPSETETSRTPALSPSNAEDASLAVVKDYFALYSAGMSDGSGAALRAVSTPTCESCKTAADAIDKLRDEGTQAQGGTVTITKSLLREQTSGDRVVWKVWYHQAASTLVASDGTSTTGGAGSDGVLFLEVVQAEGNWLVNGISTKVSEK